MVVDLVKRTVPLPTARVAIFHAVVKRTKKIEKRSRTNRLTPVRLQHLLASPWCVLIALRSNASILNKNAHSTKPQKKIQAKKRSTLSALSTKENAARLNYYYSSLVISFPAFFFYQNSTMLTKWRLHNSTEGSNSNTLSISRMIIL